MQGYGKGRDTTKSLKKLLPILILIFLLLGVLLFLPKYLLWHRLEEALNRLEQSFRDSPVQILADIQNSGTYHAIQGELSFPHKRLDDFQYVFDGQTGSGRILTDGIVSAAGIQLPLSVYLDQKKAAVSTELLGNRYYGITFDRFAQDIRSIPLMGWIVSDQKLKEWESSVKTLQSWIETFSQDTKAPLISLPEMELLKSALLAFPAKMEWTSLQSEQNQCLALRMVYHISEERLPQWLEAYFLQDAAIDSEVTAVFYLSKDTLLLTQVQFQEGEGSTSIRLDQTVPGIFHVQAEAGNAYLDIAFGTEEERWQIRRNGVQKNACIRWNRENGQIQLTDQKGLEAAVILRPEPDAVYLSTDNLEKLAALLEMPIAGENIRLQIRIRQGNAFTAPDFKNLSEWSFEDFLSLLDAIGTLIGWEIQ